MSWTLVDRPPLTRDAQAAASLTSATFGNSDVCSLSALSLTGPCSPSVQGREGAQRGRGGPSVIAQLSPQPSSYLLHYQPTSTRSSHLLQPTTDSSVTSYTPPKRPVSTLHYLIACNGSRLPVVDVESPITDAPIDVLDDLGERGYKGVIASKVTRRMPLASQSHPEEHPAVGHDGFDGQHDWMVDRRRVYDVLAVTL